MKKLLYLFMLLVAVSGCEKDDEIVSEPITEVEIINENNFTKLTESSVIVNITENIISVTGNEVVISTTTEKIQNLQIGQYFVSGKSENAPNGFAREITDISKNGDVITFQTEQAGFDDIYEEVSIDVKAEIDYDNFIPVNKSKSLKSTQRPISVSYSDDLQVFEINTVLYDDDGNYETTNDQLMWDGTLEIEENSSKFIFNSRPFTTKIFNLTMDLKLKAINTLSNTQEFEISSEPFELAKVPLTLGLPTSIAVNAFLVLRMGVDGNITAAVSVSNETNIRALSTINYDNENDQWQFFQASPPVSITTENSFNGSIALSVSPYLGVGLTLAFTSYDTANAGIFLDSNLRFNANIDTALPQINWDYGYFFELNVEANVDVMGTFMDVDYDSTLWDSDYTQLGQGTFYLSSLKNTSPLDNAVLNTSPIVFGWSSTISELVTYVVFMGDSEANLDVIGTSSSLTYTLIDTPANGTYFWKVFAVNNDDVIISESSIFSFEFDDTILIPTLTTTSVTQITETTAISGGNVTDNGGSTVTAKGVCYSTNPNPTTANNTTSDGLNVGVFTSNITGLTQNTTYYVRAYATNSSGTAYGNEEQFTTDVSGGIPTVTTTAITDITETTATSGGNVTDDGGNNVTAKGVCWSTNPNPTTENDTTNEGTGQGSYTSVITSLTENTTYYVRSYATNSEGTAYGVEQQFTTLANISIPTVTTTAITEITETTATSGGNIVSDGGSLITDRGICYSTNPNPTTANNTTSDGTNVGVFTSNITGLTENTTYYVRAYATNSSGTAYGDEIEFTTQNSGGSGTYPGQTVFVQGGSFQMGSNSGQSDEQPIHTVSLSSFNIGKYEVTNAEYASFMNAIVANSSGSVGGTRYLNMDSSSGQINYTGGQFVADAGKANHPVIMVTWFGAKAFAEHYGGRLPTEAEWEFAARGGNNSNGYTYSGSNTVGDVAWYNVSTGSQPIGTKAANELGIHDMSGNVWEWCNDWDNVNYYSTSPENNPQGPSSGSGRVLRGGGWDSSANYCRAAYRGGIIPAVSNKSIGFRVVFP